VLRSAARAALDLRTTSKPKTSTWQLSPYLSASKSQPHFPNIT